MGERSDKKRIKYDTIEDAAIIEDRLILSETEAGNEGLSILDRTTSCAFDNIVDQKTEANLSSSLS